MASVLKVYNALKDISNKEQRVLSPLLSLIRLHISRRRTYTMSFFEDFIKAKGMMRQSMDLGRDRSPRKLSAEDVSMYIKEEPLNQLEGNRFEAF